MRLYPQNAAIVRFPQEVEYAYGDMVQKTGRNVAEPPAPAPPAFAPSLIVHSTRHGIRSPIVSKPHALPQPARARWIAHFSIYPRWKPPFQWRPAGASMKNASLQDPRIKRFTGAKKEIA